MTLALPHARPVPPKLVCLVLPGGVGRGIN